MAAWAALLAVFIGVAGQLLESATTTELSLGSSYGSSQASERLERFGSTPTVEVIIVKSDSGLTVDEPEFAAKVQEVFVELTALGPDKVGPLPRSFTYYHLALNPLFAAQAEQLVSADRTSTLIIIEMVGDIEQAERNVGDALHIVEAANEAPGFTVRQSGRASISYENNELALEDLEQGERVGVPVALLVLLLLFGAVVAALVPHPRRHRLHSHHARHHLDHRAVEPGGHLRPAHRHHDRPCGGHRLRSAHHLAVP